jgi:hypothetical protein
MWASILWASILRTGLSLIIVCMILVGFDPQLMAVGLSLQVGQIFLKPSHGDSLAHFLFGTLGQCHFLHVALAG